MGEAGYERGQFQLCFPGSCLFLVCLPLISLSCVHPTPRVVTDLLRSCALHVPCCTAAWHLCIRLAVRAAAVLCHGMSALRMICPQILTKRLGVGLVGPPGVDCPLRQSKSNIITPEQNEEKHIFVFSLPLPLSPPLALWSAQGQQAWWVVAGALCHGL